MVLRGDWVARNKGLDERFFFYGEDVELCHRVWRSGFRCRYDPASTVVHLGGSSSDPSRMATGTRSYHQWRARYLIQGICYGSLAKLFVQTVDLLTIALRVARGRITGRTNKPDYVAMAEVLRLLVRNWSKWSEGEA